MGLEGLERRDVQTTWGFAWPMPQILTISFVPDGTQVGSQSSDLNAYATRAWGANWEVEALKALQAWIPHAQINVGLHADDGDPLGSPGLRQGSNDFGDIRVAAVPMANDVIASAVPFEPAAGTWSGDVLINSARSGPAVSPYFTFLHEFGHVFGFADNLDPTSVNDRYFAGPRTDLSPSDVVALQDLYGARQPDAYEGTAGNDTPATATVLTLPAGQASQSIAADITTATDVDSYAVTLPAASNELVVRLKTSGLSLLVGSLTVFDAGGSVVASTSATDPRSGDLVASVANPTPGQTYRITVRAADPSFGVGQYALSIDTNQAQAATPQSSFLAQYGSTYLLSILSDGVSSNPAAFQGILRLLFASGGDPSLESDNVRQGLSTFLAQAGTTPQGSRSVGTLLAEILSAEGSSQINPGEFGAVVDQLNRSGALKQVVSDLISSGGIDQILQTLVTSGQLGTVFQDMINSGAMTSILGSALNSPQGPALLDEIGNILQQSVREGSGQTGGQAVAPVLAAKDMINFYRVLLDNNNLDPVIDSFLKSGLLYNSFASVSQETLTRSFEITEGIASQPNLLGAELRQFFAHVGTPTGLVTPEEGVAMITALRPTPFFDAYYRALMDAGGLDEISVKLASSGALDEVFTKYLTTDQVGTLIGSFVRSNALPTLLPLLAQDGVLEGMIRSALQSGSIGPLLKSLSDSGALQGLTAALRDSGSLAPLIKALATTDTFSSVLVQMFESGQLRPITQVLASSGELATAIAGIAGTGQFSNIIDELLSINSPVVNSALNDLAMQFLPTPATSFDQAIPLAAATASAANDVRSLSAVGILGNSNPMGYYKLVVPMTPDGAPATMIVGAWRNKRTPVHPVVSIFDEQQRPVASQLLKNDNGDYVAQVLDPTPGRTYYVMVREASAVGTTDPGVFGIQAIFNDQPIQMAQVVGRTIPAGTQQVETTFVATDSRVYHWLLTSDPPSPGDAGGGVTLTVLDSSGHEVQALDAPAGQGVSVDLLLDQGTYTMIFARRGNATATATDTDTSLGFTLSGFELSDLMKPYTTDTSLQPFGAILGTPASTPTSSSSSSAGGSTTTGLALVDPSSHSFLATFGNQGGVGSINVTVARGPGGPLRTLAAQRNDDQGRGRAMPTAERSRIAAEVPWDSKAPILAQVEGPAGSDAPPSPSPTSANVAPEGPQRVAEKALSLVAGFDPAAVGDEPGVLAGMDHPHFLAGLIFVGGTAVARKIRKKSDRAIRRGDPEAAGLGHGANPGLRKDPRHFHPSSFSRPMRVLLLESPESSVPDVLRRFESWLVEDGVEVLKGRRADWDEIVTRRPDLILLDHRPPELDALDALRRWEAHAAGRSIPVILVSGDDASVAARGLDSGACDVLSPAVGPQEFRARLGAAIRRSHRMTDLESEASRDGLTGLANRSAFEAKLDREWKSCDEEGLALTLMLVDVDRFKNINDAHGHAVGDQVLRHVASALSASLRDGDLAARYGGEEFVVLAPGCDHSAAELLAERIRRKIESLSFDSIAGPARVTASVGFICISDPSRADPEESLRRADLALYAAKSAGRNVARCWENIEAPGSAGSPSAGDLAQLRG